MRYKFFVIFKDNVVRVLCFVKEGSLRRFREFLIYRLIKGNNDECWSWFILVNR